jgi:hypothetical protein
MLPVTNEPSVIGLPQLRFSSHARGTPQAPYVDTQSRNSPAVKAEKPLNMGVFQIRRRFPTYSVDNYGGEA